MRHSSNVALLFWAPELFIFVFSDLLSTTVISGMTNFIVIYISDYISQTTLFTHSSGRSGRANCGTYTLIPGESSPV